MGILVVDDSQASRMLHRQILETQGYSGIATASSAREAFQYLGMQDSTGDPSGVDLILMDVSMPEMDGVEACFWIKANERLANIPVVMVTSHQEMACLNDAFAAGAMDYITKPVNKIELLSRVCSALALKYEIDQRKIALRKLEARVQELERASVIKSEILANVTHDLKQPLTSIEGSIDLILHHREAVGPLSERQHRYLEWALRSSQKITTMVDELLDVSSMEAGKLQVTPVELEALTVVQGVIDSMERQILDRGMNFVLNIPPDLPRVKADQLRLSRVMDNLLSNACKYATYGTTVTINARQNAGMVEIAVTNSGPGISEADQTRLFDKFFRANQPASEEVPGTGLGLFIVKHLVEAQGGRVWVQSAEGVGTTFTFALPAAGVALPQ